MKQNRALIIMAKYPDPDQVKTRLRVHISDDRRIAIYTKLMVDTIAKLNNIEGADTYIAFSPATSEHYFSRFSTALMAQPEGDMGQRMSHAIISLLAAGYHKVVLVGVDIPGLSGEIVLKAFSLLDKSDVVFGPAEDGGYYLVGLKAPLSEIFTGITWSSKKTLEESLQKASLLGCQAAFTDMLFDVDTISDVRRSGLCDHYP